MKKYDIFLNSIVQAKNFCDAIKGFDFEIQISDNKSTANAKDIMDVLTLDLSGPVTVSVCTQNSQSIEEKIIKFIK